jgi:phosphonate transport system substrate-binding protein
MITSSLRIGACLVFLLSFIACRGSENARRVLRIGFVPSENVQEVAQNAQPIVTLLQEKLSMEVQPFVATDYTGVVEALRADKLDTAFLTPASYVLARDEADVRVILKSERQGSPFYYAAIITHTDSGISNLEDLRDKTFAFTDPLSTSGNVFPRKMFREKGIDPNKDFKRVLFSGGHDATVLAVLHRKVDGGATYSNFPDGKDAAWLRYLRDLGEQNKIKAIAYSEPIPADNLVINNRLDVDLAKRIAAIFLELSKDPAGKKMLRDLYQIDGFVPATDEDYDSVRAAFRVAGIDLKESLKKKNP